MSDWAAFIWPGGVLLGVGLIMLPHLADHPPRRPQCLLGHHKWVPAHGYYSHSAGRVVEFEQCDRYPCFKEREKMA